MRFNLAAMTKQAGKVRSAQVVLRDIAPPAMFAQALFARCYRPIVNRWSAAIPRIIARYETSLPVNDGLITDSISDLADLLQGIGDELQRLVLDLVPELKAWTVTTEKWHRGRWRGAVLTASGVDISTILQAGGESETVGSTIAWNISLLKDVSTQAQQRMASAVFSAFQGRLPARDLAKQLREIISMSRRRSVNIASDQLRRMSASLDRERQDEAGISEFKWRWSHKRHGRKEHIAHDGKTFSWDKLPTLGGGPDYPGLAIYCGCRAQALLSLS